MGNVIQIGGGLIIIGFNLDCRTLVISEQCSREVVLEVVPKCLLDFKKYMKDALALTLDILLWGKEGIYIYI